MFWRRGRMSSTWRALISLPVWAVVSAVYWYWWLNTDQAGLSWLYWPLTLALLYEFFVLPTSFLYFLLKAKKPPKRFAQKNLKVAVITLCVPNSEGIEIIERQIKAMTQIKYPHDSWILDEGGDIEIKRLARKYGVKYFTRKGKDKYNQPMPPFKAKTKAGNVNAWLEHVKRYKYEYFVQFDIDHIAKPNYLDKTLGYFRDSNVAWVQAPSIYDNFEHWTARGAAEQELVLQGPLQMGFYGHSQTPFIIGSHCTYRMSAIRQIGGFQPTRAEDHLDTLMLSNLGYKGVFVPEILAVGDGPETLETYLAQQFAWAYSMFQVLIHHSRKIIGDMNAKEGLQFLFAQTWYPIWSIAYLIMFSAPIIALVTNQNIVNISGSEFIKHFVPMFIATFMLWWAARPLMQPRGLRLSWRGMLLHSVRWPIVLRAIFSAMFNIKKPYMITPKGSYAINVPKINVYNTFFLLGAISAFAIAFASFVYADQALMWQMFFVLVNLIFMATICLVDINQRIKKYSVGEFRMNRQLWMRPIMAIMAFVVLASSSLLSSSLVQHQSFAFGLDPANKVATSDLPVSQLTSQQIIDELNTNKLSDTFDLTKPVVGIYSPSYDISSSQASFIRHSFVDWRSDRYFLEQMLLSKRQGQTPLITVEPMGQADGERLLTDIVSGKHDNDFEKLGSHISAYGGTVFIRFGHEMELGQLYAWGNQDPELYKKAYIHAMNILKQKAPNTRAVWSPAGNRGAEAYYPGNENVDIVGTTVLHDKYWYDSYQPSFEYISQQRKWLNNFNKPVWVVEFGAGSADPIYQTRLIKDAIDNFDKVGFKGLIYLNMVDSNIVGPNYTLFNSKAQFIDLADKKFIPRNKNQVDPSINFDIKGTKEQPFELKFQNGLQ